MEDLAGVLVRDFGINPQGKSAPMSSFKPSAVRGGATARSVAGDLFSGDNLRYSDPSPSQDSSFDAVPKPVFDGGFFDDMVGMRNPSLAVQDDIFGLSSALPKTTSSSPYQDLLGDFGRASPPNRTSSSSPPPLDDLLGGFGPPNRTSSPPLDDLLGGFREAEPEISGKQQEDELIPGFGGGKKKERSPVKPAAEDDPFGLFGTEGAPKIQPPKPYDPLHTSGRNGVPKQSQESPARPKEDEYAWFTPPSGHVWHSDVSFIDELESLGMNKPHRSPNGHGSEGRAYDVFDFDEMERAYPVFSSPVGKTQTTIVTEDDMSSIFGTPADAATGDFPEIIGDNADRRSARFKQDQQKRVRMATALAEKKARELEVHWEQEEKHKISETVDAEIKRWAAGKEGNLRALLSSLHLVLWPGCGWQPVPLTDLITGSSVKKVHKKAQLCIHPDKVQQKGATIEQKYIAEKVFDILQEAGRKFSSEEGF